MLISQMAQASNFLPSNESFYRKSETVQTNINRELKQSNFSTDKSEIKTQDKPKTKGLTNYQYDETNYQYFKVKKYIQDNINYSKSGKIKY